MAVAALLLVLLADSARANCPGDCNTDLEVTVDEIILGVRIALGEAAVAQCAAMDSNMDTSVDVSEIVQAVRAALEGCPAVSPSPTVTASPTPSITASPTPTFAPSSPTPCGTETVFRTGVCSADASVICTSDAECDGSACLGMTGDDGFAGQRGAAYPPVDENGAEINEAVVHVARAFLPDEATYAVINGLWRVNTEPLPDDAQICATFIDAHISSISEDARSLQLEWYDASNWPIDAGDYNLTAQNDALAGLTLITQFDKDLSLQLDNSNGVNRSGYTGLRFHISGDQPSGVNVFDFAAYDSAEHSGPALRVQYTVGR